MPLTTKGITRNLIPDEASDVIRGAIAAGELEPGERLIEMDLAAKLGISRATLREALRNLTAEGLLVTKPHHGTFVVELTETDVAEIYSLREALETLAVELLVDRATEADLDVLRDIGQRMRKAVEDRDQKEIVDLDMEFHETLCKLSGHSRLHQTWSRMAGQLLTFFATADPLYDDDEFVDRHLGMINSIASGDRAEAVASIREHISNAAMLLLDRSNLYRPAGEEAP
jgi:DNA-binding GntR family transcriptional regulator